MVNDLYYNIVSYHMINILYYIIAFNVHDRYMHRFATFDNSDLDCWSTVDYSLFLLLPSLSPQNSVVHVNRYS